MFKKVDGNQQKSDFLDKAKIARQERANTRQKHEAAICIQKYIRRFLAKRRLKRQMWQALSDVLQIPENPEDEYKPQLKPATEVYKALKDYFIVCSLSEDVQKMEYICKYLLASMGSDNLKHSYVSLVLNKDYTLKWIQQLKDVLCDCCSCLKSLKTENSNDMRIVSTLLATLITFTSPNKWKILSGKNGEALRPGMNQLCNNIMGHLNAKGLYPALQALLNSGLARSKPTFRPAAFTAIMTLAIRPLVAANLSDNLLTVFLLHILSVPAVVHHMNIMSQECLIQMMTHRIFSRSIELLCHEQSTKIIFNALEGNYALCLLANLIQLGDAEKEGLVENTNSFMFVVTRLLECCKIYVQNKKSSLSHWHPVLGWFQQKTDQGLYEALPIVEQQLQLLWNVRMMHILFEQLFAYNDLQAVVETRAQTATSKNIFKKALEKAGNHKTSSKVRLDSPVLVSTCLACGMYLTAIQTLTQLRLSILSGLTCQDVLLPRLWKLITDLGPQCGLKAFMDVMASRHNDMSHVLFHLLHLGCETATHIITILDDVELYEQSKPFNASQLEAISCFLNHLIFRAIWSGCIDSKYAGQDPVFQAVHGFLMLLYQRDCRRSFTPPDHWLIKEIRVSAFMSELERGRKSVASFLLQKVPHIIPHRERVMLFRKNVAKEKDVLGVTESACASPHSTLITVHRPRLIEDGYRQLALLPSNALKGIIRVKFINEQGLDEAGIDQDGVFKEFLEETIMRVFDPSLNLFKVTSEQKLYPSSTSYIQENHLALFEFVGRMLGKAVYEGIVVDVPFAPFFLGQIMGHQHSATYSSMDELPSLDPELYKSLTYIKHYEGDISDLELTFSYDEDIMGKVVTHELVPGGKVLPVTNENKISYVHLMAHFKMHSQIKDQTLAFIHGFRSIINPEWLAMFSTNELQKLISGDTADVDLEDLRKHTQYYGGFHNNHKVVSWLWDILDKDFNAQERSLFLKFVTSCSKPPLLGFAHLEPPFSIRCVEVSDDQDTGDTVGSVLKGFFNIRKKDPVSRLPTSSTCFNLLKLPNYQKKSTLREKLRYAITSNTGFELS